MKKLNTDMILGYCCGCGSTFLNKFYVIWSVIHYKYREQITASLVAEIHA